MLAALVIIPAMATTGAKLDQGGPGLLFIYLPHLIKTMPGGRIIAIIFFVAVFLAGMTSLMNLYEAPIATVQEKTGLGRIPSCKSCAERTDIDGKHIHPVRNNALDKKRNHNADH